MNRKHTPLSEKVIVNNRNRKFCEFTLKTMVPNFDVMLMIRQMGAPLEEGRLSSCCPIRVLTVAKSLIVSPGEATAANLKMLWMIASMLRAFRHSWRNR